MFDYGNPLVGELHEYTQKANFIEWQPASRPNVVYFANQLGGYAAEEKKVPLASLDNRVIMLEWEQIKLQPGQTFSYTISVGMADNDPKTGLPVKPYTGLY
jgi:hypothetical protein